MITDPIEWIRDVMIFPTEPLSPPQVADGNAILDIAEQARLEKLTDAELAEEMRAQPPSAPVLAEAMERLASRAYRAAPPVEMNQDRPGLPEGFHLTTGPGLPPGGVPCGCIHGSDHDERYFEVPPDGEPREDPTTSEDED